MTFGDERWKSGWQNRDDYADLFYRRAVGELPEMESSEALASLLAPEVRAHDSILDVGCGGGHYLRSLRREIQTAFSYTGIDATEDFLDAARRAWDGTPEATFENGDVFDLRFSDASFDVVTCNNVLLHLPSIAKPLSELVRVAKRVVVVRMLVGDRSFRIQEVYTKLSLHGSAVEPADEFDEEGEPRSFAYLNIYGKPHLEALFQRIATDSDVEFIEDTFFDPGAIERSGTGEWDNRNPTCMLGGKQILGNIIAPWHFIVVRKRS